MASAGMPPTADGRPGETPRRTVRLVERRPRECRLRRADVDCVLADHRDTIQVVPTRQPGRYRLTARGRIGTILTPGCRLVVRPKLPLENLFSLLDSEARFTDGDDSVNVTGDSDLIDVLAIRLGGLMAARERAGLHRGYVERRDEQPFLQGRLDVAAQLRDAAGQRTHFHCLREEFTTDGPWNQLPKAAAEALLGTGLLAPVGASALRRALPAYEAIRSLPLTDPTLAIANHSLLPPDYRPLWELAQLIAAGLRPAERRGTLPCPAFLIDLERAFENFITRAIQQAFADRADGNVAAQHECVVPSTDAGAAPLRMKPDIIVRAGETARVILDAKWKRLAGAPEPGDLAQVLAYGTVWGCDDVRLVYPGRSFRAVRYRVGPAGMALTLHTLAVAGSRADLDRSVGRLVRSLGIRRKKGSG